MFADLSEAQSNFSSALRRNELCYIDSLGVLNEHGGIEEAVSGDDVSGGAAIFENADGGLGDRVICNDVVVAREEDAGFGAIENLIVTDARLIALDANAIENGGREGFVAVDGGIVAVNEEVDLADASRVAGDLDAVGLCDEDVGGDRGAGGRGGTRRPNVVGDQVVQNRSRSAKADLNTVLRGTGCWA